MKKPSSKGGEYKLYKIKDKRQRLYSRLLRKNGAIEELFFISKNKAAVEEDSAQFNDILKLVVAAHEECKQYMEEEEINNSDEWLDEVDEMIFNFKRKVHSRLKETNEDDRCSKASSKTKCHSSKSSRRSSKPSSSGSFTLDRIKVKVKLAELLA